MKKKLTLILIVCAIVCTATSCARKINGATPHRRDRNCGCENLYSSKQECVLARINDEVMNHDEAMIDDETMKR